MNQKKREQIHSRKKGHDKKKYEWLRVNIFLTMKLIFGLPSALAISTHDKP